MQIDRRRYSKVVVLTGAGISVASGLRPFRGPDGVWDEHDVERLGQPSALQRHPEEFWRLFGLMRKAVLQAKPNPGHLALARWEAQLAADQQLLLVTQNVDGLHQAAGSRNVSEIHGNLLYTRCNDPVCPLPRFRDEVTHHETLPLCPRCGSLLRPDIVLFGEALPAAPSWAVQKALRDCDLFLAIGTSGLVYPAAGYVRGAEYAGARTVYLNLEPMDPPNPAFQEQVLGRAEEILSRFLGLEG